MALTRQALATAGTLLASTLTIGLLPGTAGAATADVAPTVVTQDSAPAAVEMTRIAGRNATSSVIGETLRTGNAPSAAQVRVVTLDGAILWSTPIELVAGAQHRVAGVGAYGEDAVATITTTSGTTVRTWAVRLNGVSGAVTNSVELKLDSGTFEGVGIGASAAGIRVWGSGNGKLAKKKTNGIDPVVFTLSSTLDVSKRTMYSTQGNDAVVAGDYGGLSNDLVFMTVSDNPKNTLDDFHLNLVNKDGGRTWRKVVPSASRWTSVAIHANHGIYTAGTGVLAEWTLKGAVTRLHSLGAGTIATGIALGVQGLTVAGTAEAGFQGAAAVGAGDAFLAALDYNGNMWSRSVVGTTANESSVGVAPVSSKYMLAGVTKGSIDGVAAADSAGDTFTAVYTTVMPSAPGQPGTDVQVLNSKPIQITWEKSAPSPWGLPTSYVVSIFNATTGKELKSVTVTESAACVASLCSWTQPSGMSVKFNTSDSYMVLVSAKNDVGTSWFSLGML